jgi:hypothetical protein
MVFEDFYWGNSPSIEPISVEVSFFTNGLGLTRQVRYAERLDANPIEVLYDICINDWGMLGIVDPIFNLTSWRRSAYNLLRRRQRRIVRDSERRQGRRFVQRTSSAS